MDDVHILFLKFAVTRERTYPIWSLYILALNSC